MVAGMDDCFVTRTQRTFVATPCYMETSRLSKEGGRNEHNLPGWQWVPVVYYKYTVDGKEYASDVVCSRESPILSPIVADKFLKRFGPARMPPAS